jgi:hypothetical protein
MKNAITNILKVIAIITGIFSGFVGGVHGYFEITHGSVRPEGTFFDAISGKMLATTNPKWTGWPATTVIPNFLIAGILVVIVGLFIIGWTILRVNRKGGGQIIFILAVVLCFLGGGFVPPLFGVISGISGMVIEKLVHK